jgi:hypothetical protein
MRRTEIPSLRLMSQLIEGKPRKTLTDVVSSLGALQAQDFPMAKWAIGKRLPESTEGEFDKAFALGEVLRTHLLRPTWHLVAASDIRWMLRLTAPNIKASLRLRHKDLELTESVLRKCRNIFEKALVSRKVLTREALAHRLEKAGITTRANNRLSHILLSAELDGLVCSGPLEGNKQTYALLDDRIPRDGAPSREESLAELARRYFRSRGPATLQDFIWWSGLRAKDAALALELTKSDLLSESLDSKLHWFSNSHPRVNRIRSRTHLLPAFDEFLIAYRDRSAVIGAAHLKRAVSSNGIFYPIVVVDGTVAGIWRRRTEKARVTVDVQFFRQPGRNALDALEPERQALADFLGKPVDLKLAKIPYSWESS